MAEETTLATNLAVRDFKIRGNHALKHYLTLKKSSVEGSHQDLAARAFTCYENSVPVEIDIEQIVTDSYKNAKKKLNIYSLKVPDPFSVKSGWTEEEEGMINWPAIYFMILLNVLKQNHHQILLTD